MQIEEDFGGLPPRILLEPHSLRMGKAITKNFFTSWPGLSVDLVHKYLKKKNPPYLGTYSNRGRASNPHKKRSCTQTQIQSMTSFLKPHIQKTPIFSFSRQLICPGNFIHTKQEGSQSRQAGVISISSSLTILTQTPSTQNPSRQDQAWTSQQRTKNSTDC